MQSDLHKRGRFSVWGMTRLAASIRRLRDDHEGVAAVEFAMIAPIMLMMLIGCFECSQALTIDRRNTQIASSVADLVARAPVAGLTSADVDALMLIANQLMKPYSTTPLTVTVISVKAQTVNNALQIVVDWSRDNTAPGSMPLARNSTYAALPPGLLASGESVVVTEAKYLYTPVVGASLFIQAAYNMKETFYLKPRNSSCVNLLPINCVTGANMGK